MVGCILNFSNLLIIGVSRFHLLQLEKYIEDLRNEDASKYEIVSLAASDFDAEESEYSYLPYKGSWCGGVLWVMQKMFHLWRL